MNNDIWMRPVIVPVPVSVPGTAEPVLILKSTEDMKWKFSLTPPENFRMNGTDTSEWPEIQVPGECAMQGFGIEYDIEYPYKLLVDIPSDFSGKRIILRFDGVHSYARVWVNGIYVRDHQGGFTSWDCDITGLVTPGQQAWITVGVKDMGEDDPSYVSVYIKHKAAGILRDVKLIALPQDYVTRFYAETDFDDTYTNAALKVTAAMAFNEAGNGTLNLTLTDPDGNPVPISPNSINLTSASPEAMVIIPVNVPKKWDSEHPWLYTLEACVVVGGKTMETLSRKVGFRKLEVTGNEYCINGQKVKLRGVNRHDSYPISGRSINAELCEKDVKSLKDANVNFIRTSHYPPTESFLEYCDKYGMYVEDESAVCWCHQGKQDKPEYTGPMINQFMEMIERDRSHPCIIMWSLGNESEWGSNFEKEKCHARLEDPGRPIVFNFDVPQPTTVQCPPDAYDIRTYHYVQLAESDYPIAWGEKPILHDEFCPPIHANKAMLRRDPGGRNNWGQYIKAFWHKMFNLDGCLGAAIWAGIDDTLFLPQNILNDGSSKMGWGPWGLIDGWRREKPEHWEVKKAYSPVEIAEQPLVNPGSGNPLNITVHNRFDHTNLNEICIDWCAGADSGTMKGPDVLPHGIGVLTIPARNWQFKDIINLKIKVWENAESSFRIVDEYNLSIGKIRKTFPEAAGPAPAVAQDAGSITVSGATASGKDFSIVFSKTTGQITNGMYNGSIIITGGPYLNMAPYALSTWSLSSIGVSTQGDQAIVDISGNQGTVGADFTVKIDRDGLIATTYTLTNPPPVVNQAVVDDWCDIMDSDQGYSEIGVTYELTSSIDRLTWDRKGLWSKYPENHIGRLTGSADKVRREGVDSYGIKPEWDWRNDMRDYYSFGSDDAGGRGTNDFRSAKENIWFASAVISESGDRVRAESDGTDAVRAEIIQDSGRIKFMINNIWFYTNMIALSQIPEIAIEDGYTNTVNMRFSTDDNCIVAYSDAADGVTVDENDPSILYLGRWTEHTGINHYDSTARCTKSSDIVEFTFLGSSVTWRGPKGVDYGEADVYLDRVFDTKVNCCNEDGTLYNQALYIKSGLSYGWHTIRITGKANGWVGIDAFEYGN